MLIRFLRDFQSKHTAEVFYAAGATADLDSEHARALLDEGAAELVPLVAREGQAAPKVEPTPAPVAPKPPVPPRKQARR